MNEQCISQCTEAKETIAQKTVARLPSDSKQTSVTSGSLDICEQHTIEGGLIIEEDTTRERLEKPLELNQMIQFFAKAMSSIGLKDALIAELLTNVDRPFTLNIIVRGLAKELIITKYEHLQAISEPDPSGK